MKIGIGCDHAGFDLKDEITAYLEEKGYEIVDYTPGKRGDKIDYPIPGKNVAHAIVNGEVEKGILICGSGIGISISANKVKGIRAAVCSEPYSAEKCVQHNNAQIIAFGARIVGPDLAKMIVDAFLGAKFEGGRHEKRVALIEED